jgi:hypothetical protein
LLGHHAVEVEAGGGLVGVVVVDQGDAGALEEREEALAIARGVRPYTALIGLNKMRMRP